MKDKFKKIRIKWEQSLIRKNLHLKQELKQLKEDKRELIKDKQGLYDIINLQQESVRALDIKQRKMKEILKKSELFNDLLEVFDSD